MVPPRSPARCNRKPATLDSLRLAHLLGRESVATETQLILVPAVTSALFAGKHGDWKIRMLCGSAPMALDQCETIRDEPCANSGPRAASERTQVRQMR